MPVSACGHRHNLQEAIQIEQAGLDGLIAQGIEAGGHRGMFDPDAADEQWSTAVLVRQLTSSCTLPVIAAGGIMDGQGIRAMLDLGADAAQLGTAFILCPESSANAGYRQTLKSPRQHTHCCGHLRATGSGHAQPSDPACRGGRQPATGRLPDDLRCRQTA